MRLILILVCVAAVGIDRELGGQGDWKGDSAAWVKSVTSPTSDPAQPASIAPQVTTTPSATVTPAPVATESTPPPASSPPVWTPPSVIPPIPDGTLTTPTQIYTDARIVKVEADRVTISHSTGRAVIPMWQLGSTLQQELNYDPKAALAAASQRQSAPAPAPDETAAPLPIPQAAPPFQETTDYAAALAQAKANRQLILLHFTGSDWCYYCKMLEQEVISTPDFRQFVAANYIYVTLDFPHDIPLADNLKQQNDSLAQKFHVNSFPTLLVIDGNENEMGRESGYHPGSGPAEVMATLRSFRR